MNGNLSGSTKNQIRRDLTLINIGGEMPGGGGG